jgi:hypothetical protein
VGGGGGGREEAGCLVGNDGEDMGHNTNDVKNVIYSLFLGNTSTKNSNMAIL